MFIEYIYHALRRMNKRGISKVEVEQAIRQPDLSFRGHLGRYVSIKKYKDKLLKLSMKKKTIK